MARVRGPRALPGQPGDLPDLTTSRKLGLPTTAEAGPNGARPPTPGPSSASERMRRQATRDTVPEIRLRRTLRALGHRYRVHVRPLPGLRRTADIVFVGAKVAVFVDGCFWHSCPDHSTVPSSNGAWWAAKLSKNVERDADTDRRLAAEGWLVVRVWEHEDPEVASARVASAVRERRLRSASARRG
ncbi:MAG: very short patch repair endonuclease [Actinobacteria bacterium]|nr:very short patch repair endonuclease [Actinomycetota bacterium]